MIVLYASIPIDPEKREEALALAETLVEESNREEGMIEYRAMTDVEDETMLRFVEQYEDQAAVESHTQTDHYQEFAAALPELLAGDPEVIQFDVDSVSELEL